MSKYDPLLRHLEGLPRDRVAMRFEEIEAILGFPLPQSSRRHRAWWSNNLSNSAITRAWIDAGYRTEQVDLEGRRLVFRRTRKGPEAAGAVHRSGRHPFIGSMKGTVTLAPDLDLAAPADPEWGEIAYGDDR
jgi:hypothetical protein